jgi:quercetin dioxygenase-like cupin family protein
MQSWNLREIDAPEGSRSPVVLYSNHTRAVLIALGAGQKLGDHEVKERAFVTVVDGRARVQCAGETVDAETGMLFVFDPEERHSLSTDEGARLLLLLAPWPGEGHYRGEERALERSEGSGSPS